MHETIKAALSEGVPLEEDPARTLGDALRRAARPTRDAGCAPRSPRRSETVFLDEYGRTGRQSYTRLADEASAVLGGLRQAGVRPGDPVVLQLADLRAFVTGLWACVLGGFLAAPVAPVSDHDRDGGAGARLKAAWTMLGRPWLLTGTDRAAGLRSLTVREGRPDLRIAVIEECADGPTGGEWHPGAPQDPVLVLLTSGSTGTPKGVQLSHRNILTHAAAGRQHHRQTPEDVWFNWLPLDHVGGVVMSHLRNVVVGCRQIHAPTSWVLAEPLRWIDALHEHRATFTWAPNFAFGLAADRLAQAAGSRDWDLSALRIVLNGGEPVIRRTARRFTELLLPHGLPTDAMRPVWGMSETASGQIDGVLAPDDEDARGGSRPGRAVTVGRPYPGFALRIVDDRHHVPAEGTPGALQVRGPAVTCGYYGHDRQTGPAFTQDGWFDTGDLGVLDDGALTLTGRAKDVIIVNGVNHACHELEALVEDLEEVERSFTAACAVRGPDSTTDELALFFHLKPGVDTGRALARIRDRVLHGAGINPAHLVPLPREAVPKTELGKIRRAQLRTLFEAGALTPPQHTPRPPAAGPSTAAGTPADTAGCHQPTWEPAPPPADAPTGCRDGARTLLLADQDGLAEAVAGALRERGEACTVVHPGPAFTALGPDRYVLPLTRPDAHSRLLDLLAGRHEHITRIIHLYTYAPYQGDPAPADLDRAEHATVHSLAELTAALTRHNPDRTRRELFVFAGHSRHAHPGDRIAYERTPAAVMLKSLAQEVPWLAVRHVDLPFTTADQAAPTVLGELATPHTTGGDVEFAHRSGDRLVRRLTPFTTPTTGGAVFRREGLYAVSGGLGAVATHQRTHCGMAATSLAWGMWDNLGISRDYPFRELLQRRGHRILHPGRALELLDTVLGHPTPHVLIGANPTPPTSPRHTTADPPTRAGTNPRPARPKAGSAPPPPQPGSTDSAAPGDEQTLTRIWCEVLRRRHIGRHDSFFALGGHSLLASQMLARIRERLGVELTFSALYADPTIAGLARRLPGTRRDSDDVVLPIRPQGSLPPLFCIHPASGVAWSYANLLPALAPDRPLYGLQARGLAGNGPLADSVAEMATDYVAAIRAIHPQGPYHLLGASFGGLVAHAMTHLLQTQGRQTGVLAVLDTWPPTPNNRPAPEHLEQLLMRVLLRDAGRTDAIPTQPDSPISRSDVAAALNGSGSALAGLGPDGVDAVVRIMHNSIRLEGDWTPPRIQGDVLHITAADRMFGSGTPQAAWAPFVAGQVRSHESDFAHVDMLQPAPGRGIGHILETTFTSLHPRGADHSGVL
ncbi:AMP-binding protein [Streptomyces sp. NPDC092307]|uniref:AMP-binding protein n=1 Tax=Streptomyces sp. NPDC092307 TaxID=3366013 RepID=UPI00382C8473